MYLLPQINNSKLLAWCCVLMTASQWFSTLFLHVKAGFELERKSQFVKKCCEFQGEEEAPPSSKTLQAVEGDALPFCLQSDNVTGHCVAWCRVSSRLAKVWRKTIANNLFQFTEDCKSQFLVTLNIQLGVTFCLNALLNLDSQKQKVDSQIVKFSLQIGIC